MSEYNAFITQPRVEFVGYGVIKGSIHRGLQPVWLVNGSFCTLLRQAGAYHWCALATKPVLREPNWLAYDGSTKERSNFNPAYLG